MPLRWMLLIYCVVYCIAWLFFTLWWQQAASGCEGALDFRRAFLLSLEPGMKLMNWWMVSGWLNMMVWMVAGCWQEHGEQAVLECLETEDRFFLDSN